MLRIAKLTYRIVKAKPNKISKQQTKARYSKSDVLDQEKFVSNLVSSWDSQRKFSFCWFYIFLEKRQLEIYSFCFKIENRRPTCFETQQTTSMSIDCSSSLCIDMFTPQTSFAQSPKLWYLTNVCMHEYETKSLTDIGSVREKASKEQKWRIWHTIDMKSRLGQCHCLLRHF